MASAFIAGVQAAGGTFYWEDGVLRMRAPKGALSADLRAQWPGIKPELLRFIAQCRQAEQRWQSYLAAHTAPGWCSQCGAVIALFVWEDRGAAVCTECAWQELERHEG